MTHEINPSSLRPFDEVVITGWAYSPLRYFDALRATVATVITSAPTADDPDATPSIKVWPHDTTTIDAHGNRDDSGKVWFRMADIRSAVLVKRDDVVYLDADNVRYLTDPVYAREMDARLKAVQFTDAELDGLGLDEE